LISVAKPPGSDDLEKAAEARRLSVGAAFPALAVCDPDNVYWLSGSRDLRGRASLLFDGRDWKCLVESGRVRSRPGLPAFLAEGAAGWAEHLLSVRADQLGVDGAPGPHLSSALGPRDWIDVSRQIELRRQLKDQTEINLVTWNVSVLNEALKVVAFMIEPGRREFDLWAKLESELRHHAGEDVEITGNLGSGQRTLEHDPHATEAVIRLGDPVLLDAYPRLHGYYADLTRTWVCGAPRSEFARAHAAVGRALKSVASRLSPGAIGGELDRLARKALEESGYPRAYSHHTGHGFGVKQQESPWLRQSSQDVLEKGMVIAVEPACYLPGMGGVRIEQDFLITEEGAQPLGDTTFSLDPLARQC
jgi:Xaa-Pro aminopeptidase